MYEEKHARYRVRVGKKFLGKNAKPYTRYFHSEKEARVFITSLKKKESGDFKAADELEISKTEMKDIKAALRFIKDTPLLDVVTDWIEAKKREAEKPNSLTVSEAIKKLMALKDAKELGERHKTEMEAKLKEFFAPYLETPIADITYDQAFDRVIAPAGKPPNQTEPTQSQKNKRVRYANILFRFALRVDWITKNPLKAYGETPISRSKVVVLSPKQIASLIHHCQILRPNLLPSILIKCFSGVRNSELFHLRWENIKEEITVPAAFVKTGKERCVVIEPVLKIWLDWIIETTNPKPEDLVCTLPRRKPRKGVKESPEWKRLTSAWYKAIKPVSRAAGIVPWPQNALRHLFGSYHLALYLKETLTATQMGNSVATVKAHYTNAVRGEASDVFWSLGRNTVAELLKAPVPVDDTPIGPRRNFSDLD